MRTMDRLATEYEATPEGELRPRAGAAWRVERALGERDLHRRLAALADAAPTKIVRAASTYGPLRLGAELARVVPDGAWDELGMVLGQAALPEWTEAVDWLDRDCAGPIPAVIATALPILRALASIPAPVRAYIDLLFAGADATTRRALAAEIEAHGGFDAGALQSALAGSIMELAAQGSPSAMDAARPCEDAALGWAIRRFTTLQSVLAGLSAPPPGVDPHGLVFGAVTTMSDALTPLEQSEDSVPEVERLVRELHRETLDGWYQVAKDLADWVEAIDLRALADLGGLTTSDVASLRRLLASLLDDVRDGAEDAPTAGELEALLRPRFRLRLERRLQAGGVWPYPADRIVGTYWRALWAAWTEFTDERPRQRCAEPGCAATFRAHGNRLYCDVHRRAHDLERKRRH